MISECSCSDDSCSPRPVSTDASKMKHVKSIQKHVKSDKLCAVCGDKALGCNFDAVSCESCKAFFRRNAFKESVRISSLFIGILYYYIHAVDLLINVLTEFANHCFVEVFCISYFNLLLVIMKWFNHIFVFIRHRRYDSFVDKQMTLRCSYFLFEELSLFAEYD